MDRFSSDALKAHNDYRTRHGAPPLKSSKELNKVAQKWAEHLARSGSFQHSDNTHNGSSLGENIAMKWSSGNDEFTGQQVTDQWYSEEPKYDYSGSNNGAGAGHFSQVVWIGSQELGIGKAKGRDGKNIVVANYSPAGNFIGQFKNNVLPSGAKAKAQASNPSTSGRDVSSVSPHGKKTHTGSGAPIFGNTEPFGQSKSAASSGQGYTKTVVKETVTRPDGTTVTTVRETFSSGNELDDDNEFHDRFKKMDMGKERLREDKHIGEKVNKPQNIDDFIKDSIASHNRLRQKHGVPSLKHSKDLSKHAQKWADHLVATNTLQHNSELLKGERLGENIASKWSSSGDDYTGDQVTQQWYSEISKHQFGVEPTMLASGHFTQVVWKGSREVGLGKAMKDGRVIVVANYRPAGNLGGHFSDNVPALKK